MSALSVVTMGGGFFLWSYKENVKIDRVNATRGSVNRRTYSILIYGALNQDESPYVYPEEDARSFGRIQSRVPLIAYLPIG